MTNDRHAPILKGKKALVCGIANEHSIAWGCAKAFHELGAELAITCAGEKTRTYVEPLVREVGAPIFMPLDVTRQEDIAAVFAQIEQQWGSSTCSCTRSRGRPRKTCRAASSTAARKASARRWTSPAIPSCAWRAWPRR